MMKILFKFVLLMGCLCAGHIVNAQDSMAFISKAEASLSFGYVEDNLSWSIAGNLNGENPNIYSELIWSDVRAAQMRFHFQFDFLNFLIFSSDFTGATIRTGSATDSDYSENN